MTWLGKAGAVAGALGALILAAGCLPPQSWGYERQPHARAAIMAQLAGERDLPAPVAGHEALYVYYPAGAPPADERANPPGWSPLGSTDDRALHVAVAPAGDYHRDRPNYQALLTELSRSRAAWKIVLIEESIFLPAPDRRMLDLADLCEAERVCLVVSPGGGYVRSAGIGSSADRVVRYMTIGRIRDTAAPPAWAEFAAPQPAAILIEANAHQLVCRAVDVDGRQIDLLTLTKEQKPERFFSVSEVLAAGRKK